MSKKQKNPILVCIDAHPLAHLLLRNGYYKSLETKAPWIVLYIETPEHYQLDGDARERVLSYLTSAEEMGAEVHHVEARHVVSGILTFIEENRKSNQYISNVIVGQSPQEGFWANFRPSTVEKLTRGLRNSKSMVQIVPLARRNYAPNWYERFHVSALQPKELLVSICFVIFAALASEFLQASITSIEWRINIHNVSSFFLIACVIASMLYGLVPGLVAAILSFVILNYFYISPLHNFGLEHAAEAVSLIIFMASAVAISFLGAFNRASNAALARKEKRSQALYKIHRMTSDARSQHEALKILHEELSNILEMKVVFFLPSTMNPNELSVSYPRDYELSDKDQKALESCWDSVRATGLGTLSITESSWRFEPLVTPNGEIGVLGILVPRQVRLEASFGRMLGALADQAASILERAELLRMMGESRIREEREKFRAMLLSSVSHDLKTPLASIIGSLSVFQRMRRSGKMTDEIESELVQTALDESQRLNSFITNILDMTRIESGDITFHAEWEDVEALVNKVVKRLKQQLTPYDVEIKAPDGPLEAELDKMMSEQVLQNIIDNAAKYSKAGTKITIAYQKRDSGLAINVSDEGDGIPEEKLEAIFDKYERLKQSDSKVAGTGLGLAITKAVMEKQGGSIIARNRKEGGAEFTIWFPKCRSAKNGKEQEDAA